MIRSLIFLFKAPYNQQHIFFAFIRWFIWKKIRLFKKVDFEFSVWYNRKVHLYFDSVQSMWLMYNYIIDWEEFNLIKDYLRPGYQVFDIGANVGYYTLWMSCFTSLPGNVHSFEPDPNNFYRLKSNLELNKMNELVAANNFALSNSNGEVLFTKGLDIQNRIANTEDKRVRKVKCTTIDNYCILNNINEIAYLKIDVEGFEPLVLEGAKEMLLAKAIDIIQLEINEKIALSGNDSLNLIEYLKKFGYLLYRYDTHIRKLEPCSYYLKRENYFAIANVDKVSELINSGRASNPNF